METAIPVGLIVGQVVSNSLKYAFSPENRGLVSVELGSSAEDGSLRLLVSDDGRGMPIETLREKSGLGLKLVEAFAVQLKGKISMETEKGFRLTVDGIEPS